MLYKIQSSQNDLASIKILSITYANENAAYFEPNGIINHSYFTLGNTDAVLCMFSSRNGIPQYALLKSKTVNTAASLKSSNKSSWREMG